MLAPGQGRELPLAAVIALADLELALLQAGPVFLMKVHNLLHFFCSLVVPASRYAMRRRMCELDTGAAQMYCAISASFTCLAPASPRSCRTASTCSVQPCM